MRIGRADTNRKVALIAEVGNNHEGSLSIARDLIFAAWDAGADAVKLQTLIPELFVSPEYPERLEQMRKFALSIDETISLIHDFAAQGIFVFSTPLDLTSACELIRHVPLVKVSSGDLTFTHLLETVGASGRDVILSTGMSTMSEIRTAVSVTTSTWPVLAITPSLAIMHCVSAYPATPSDANLAAIRSLRQEFPVAVIGYSDHVAGVDVAARSVSVGAQVVEKHFTLDKTYSQFRDHALSADPRDFGLLRSLVDEIYEELGSGEKTPSHMELENRVALRRSITVRSPIEPGTVIASEDLVCQRPGTGLPPSEWNQVVGRIALRSMAPGHVVSTTDFI